MRYSTLALAFVLFASSACSTTIQSTKVTATNDAKVRGLRYSLPRPFLLVEPDPEVVGGFTVEVIYLPDTNQTYAIDASSRLGSYTFNAKVKDGLLQKVVLTKGSPDVASESIRVAGELAKGELQRRDSALKKAEEASKAAAAELDKLEAAVNSAQLDFDRAEKTVATWEKLKSDWAAAGKPIDLQVEMGLRQARAALEESRLKLAAAKATLEEQRSESSGAANTLSTAFADKAADSRPANLRTVWGPVLYEVVDECDPRTCGPAGPGGKPAQSGKVALRTVKWDMAAQKAFEVVGPKPKPPEASPALLSPIAGTSKTFDFSTSTTETLELVFDQSVAAPCPGNGSASKDGSPLPLTDVLKDYALSVDEKTWSLKFHKSNVPVGKYQLSLVFSTKKDCSAEFDVVVLFEVVP